MVSDPSSGEHQIIESGHVLPPEPSIPFIWWRVAPKTAKWARPIATVSFAAIVLALVGYFLQLRGLVNLLLSRFVLAGIGVFLILAIFIYLEGSGKRIIAAVIVAAILLAVDRVTPPPSAPVLVAKHDNPVTDSHSTGNGTSLKSEPATPNPSSQVKPHTQSKNDLSSPTDALADQIAKRIHDDRTQNVGNLCKRANRLADEIMDDLTAHGWPNKLSNDAKLRESQFHLISQGFRYRLEQIKQIRDEFASLHYIDPELDEFLKISGQVGEVLPQMIAEVASGLRSLARQASPESQREPALLFFSEESVALGRPYRYQIMVTIKTEKIITEGYILVEFTGHPLEMATDFQGSKVVMSRDVTNEHLAQVLKAYSPNKYVLEIGSNAFLPDTPIRVFAGGSDEIHASKVTLF